MRAKENQPGDKASNSDPSSIELAYASLAMYADDAKLDDEDVTTLLQIATRDGTMSDREKEILRALFNRIHEEDVNAGVWNHIQDVRKRHAI